MYEQYTDEQIVEMLVPKLNKGVQIKTEMNMLLSGVAAGLKHWKKHRNHMVDKREGLYDC